MIDCSHGNSLKDHARQLDVIDEVARQIKTGNTSIIGVMLESNIEEGNQPIPDDLKEIRPGVSITDACINWDTTERALRKFSQSIGSTLKKRSI